MAAMLATVCSSPEASSNPSFTTITACASTEAIVVDDDNEHGCEDHCGCTTASHNDDDIVLTQPQQDIRDRIQHMKRLESTTYNRHIHAADPFLRADPKLNRTWRRQMIEWMYSIVTYCKLEPEAVPAAAYYMDVAVAASNNCGKNAKALIATPQQYQCLALTSLALALKVYDSPNQRSVELKSLVGLGDGSFNVRDVVQMEGRLLRLLQWKIHPPTPNCFVQQYFALFDTRMENGAIGDDVNSADMDDESSLVKQLRSITDSVVATSVASSTFTHCQPSKIAQAAIGMAIQRLAQHMRDDDEDDDDDEHDDHCDPMPMMVEDDSSSSSTESSISMADLQRFMKQLEWLDGIDSITLQTCAMQWEHSMKYGVDCIMAEDDATTLQTIVHQTGGQWRQQHRHYSSARNATPALTSTATAATSHAGASSTVRISKISTTPRDSPIHVGHYHVIC